MARDGTILRANRAELDMLGYQEHEYVGRAIADFHVDAEVCRDMLRRLAQGETLHRYEAQLHHKDGTVRDVLVESSGLWRHGEFVHTRCLTFDVTDRRVADVAADRLRAVVESSDDAIASKDLNGIVNSWNPAAERLFGYSAEEVIGRSIRLIIPPELQSEEDEVLRRVRNGDRVEHFETVRRRKDGSLVPISLTVSPVKDRHGRIIGASKIARDITERRAAEEALRSSMALKDQFLGLVSHELRTPISSIVGNAQLLARRMERLPGDARVRAAEDIATEGERLQRIVENLLVLTRLDAEAQLAKEPIELAPIVTDVVQAMRLKVPSQTIELDIHPDAPQAIAELTLVALVLQNLIVNAHKYSSAAAPVEVILRGNEEGWPELLVRDRGIGIEPADLEKVFEPFYRSASGQAHASGMGIGLAVCRRAVEALDGWIRAEPRTGGGTSFVLAFPPAGTSPAG